MNDHKFAHHASWKQGTHLRKFTPLSMGILFSSVIVPGETNSLTIFSGREFIKECTQQ